MPAKKLHQLPVDVLILIILKLPLNDIFTLILTCKVLKNLVTSNNAIWRPISLRRLIVKGKDINTSLSWYDRCRISHNWTKAIYKNNGLICHRTNYMPWLKFHNSEVLLLTVGSDLYCYPVDENGFPNGRQVQWNLSMPKIKRYDKRTDDISRFVLKDDLLACGNRNGSIAVYKIDNLNLRPQLIKYEKDSFEDGTVEVSAVDIVNNKDGTYMVTGSTDNPHVHFWSWDTENCHTDPSSGGSDFGICFGVDISSKEAAHFGAKCLALNENGDKLAIGPDGNSKPLLVDLNIIKFVIKSDESANVNQIVQDVQWHDENTICYVTHSGWLQMMDVRTHQVVYKTEDPFQAAFYCVKTDGNRAIVAGTSQHSRCVLYDVRKPHHVQLYFTQEQRKTTPVYSLDFDSTKLIAAADRGVAALNFNVPSYSAARDYSHVYN